MTMKKLLAAITSVLFMASGAFAVPVLQVGAPAGSDDSGSYADYLLHTSNPTEDDTAVTSGGTLYVAGVYSNKKVVNLGGQYSGGKDWSSFGLPSSVFDTHGAILVVSVPNGSTGTISIPGATYITLDANNSYFPNNHDPVKSNIADFMFFDIGDFTKNLNAVPEFSTETDTAAGEIKTFSGITISGYDWVHFDVMALETTNDNTDLVRNPGSHDVTWKSSSPVPEPGTMLLLGTGLLGLAVYGKRRMNREA
jgi:hypothetical protein